MVRKELPLNRVLKNSFIQPGQKGSRCQAREESASEGVLKQYGGASGSRATPQMGLFQQAVRT
jgi:hypothetical protein